MKLASLATLVTLGCPGLALACASCISSPYGDRSYNLAYIGLILMPFAVGLVIAGVFTGSWWLKRRTGTSTWRRHATGDAIDPFNEERT